jgi:hypothetical protein
VSQSVVGGMHTIGEKIGEGDVQGPEIAKDSFCEEIPLVQRIGKFN